MIEKYKNKIGPLVITFFALTTVIIWFIVRRGTEKFTSYQIFTYSLGQILGLTGMTLFALTFVLTTRLKFLESYFGGLDKVYKFHHLMGVTAFMFLLFHPILLVAKFIPNEISLAANYLLPHTGGIFSYNMATNYGMIALLSMIIIIFMTIYINMKYEKWKKYHSLMGIVFFIACLHIFIIPTDIAYYLLLRLYMILICAIGGSSYIYGVYIRPRLNKRFNYVIESVESKNNIHLINLKPLNERIPFKAGQFVFVKFKGENLSSEPHPFTIASSPLEKNLFFAIKSLGDYTESLKFLKKGNLVEIEGPYGKFNSPSSNNDQVWIAGGIGITPFLSLAKDLALSKQSRINVHFYYSARNKSEAIFLNEIIYIIKDSPNIKLFPHFSEESGHISIKQIESKFANLKNTEFFLCGPEKMTSDLYKQLRNSGVKDNSIHKEEFNFK